MPGRAEDRRTRTVPQGGPRRPRLCPLHRQERDQIQMTQVVQAIMPGS